MPSSVQSSNSSQIDSGFGKIAEFTFSEDCKEYCEYKLEIINSFDLGRKTGKCKTLTSPSIVKKLKISFFEKLISSDVSEMIMKEFIVNLYKGVKYAKKSLKGPHHESILKKSVKLKEIEGSTKKFLFMDLDQTLIYTNQQKNSKEESVQSTSFQLYIRPYALQFLSKISQNYDVYVFTAATKDYAEAVIAKLNKNTKIIQDFLCRDNCFRTQKGKIIKDLRIVENRDLKDMILVDNKSESFGLQIDNGIPILDFYGSKNDQELIHLEKILIEFSQADDVRTAIRNHFRLRELAEFSKEDLQEYLMKGLSFQRLEERLRYKQNN